MDPLTAIGLAVNIATVIDLGIRFGKDCGEVAANGITTVSQGRLDLAEHTRDAISSLQTVLNDGTGSADPALAQEDAELKDLANDIIKVSNELVTKFQKLQAGEKRRKRGVLKNVAGNWSGKREAEALEKKLRSNMELLNSRHVARLSRQNAISQDMLSSVSSKIDNSKLEQLGKTTKLGVEFKSLINQMLKAQSDQNSKLGHIVGHIDASVSEAQYDKILESLFFDAMFVRQENLDPVHEKTYEWIFYNKDTVTLPSQTFDPYEWGLQDEDTIQRRWDDFVEWLETDNEIYWLAGKPGSNRLS